MGRLLLLFFNNADADADTDADGGANAAQDVKKRGRRRMREAVFISFNICLF